MTDRRFFVDVMSDIVDSMRSTGNITSFSEVSGTYTINSVNELKNGESIVINSVNYRVSSVTSSSFVISGSTGLDFLGESWKALAPYYDYGHYLEIASRVDIKSRNSGDGKFRLFPMIILITDIKETHDEIPEILYSIDPPNIFIVDYTKPTYTAQERTELTFKPILYPLYELLVEKMVESKAISVPNNRFKNDIIMRYGWGNETVYRNDALIFNEHLDAIQFIPDNIRVYKPVINPNCLSI